MGKQNTKSAGSEELAFIPDEQRKIPLWSYIAIWWSSLIVVQAHQECIAPNLIGADLQINVEIIGLDYLIKGFGRLSRLGF